MAHHCSKRIVAADCALPAHECGKLYESMWHGHLAMTTAPEFAREYPILYHLNYLPIRFSFLRLGLVYQSWIEVWFTKPKLLTIIMSVILCSLRLIERDWSKHPNRHFTRKSPNTISTDNYWRSTLTFDTTGKTPQN